jgi:hypothetical protein
METSSASSLLFHSLLAKLSPEYGLYTSFIAGCIYWMFATSKDITIGVCALTPFVGLRNESKSSGNLFRRKLGVLLPDLADDPTNQG